jgi:MFS family permease
MGAVDASSPTLNGVSADNALQGHRPPLAPTPAGGVWARERRRLTVGLVLTITLVAFEALAIATIMPLVGRHLGDLRLYGWVFSAFMLASLVGIVQAGALADRGRLTRPMLVGVALFAAGLAIGGLAPDMAVLVAGRVVQGLGAGFVPTVAYVAISRGYPELCRPRMFAVLSTAWVVPALVGPAVAALVATTVGWRWVFLGLIPLVIVAGSVAVVALRQVPPPTTAHKTSTSYLPVLAVVIGTGVALASLTSGDVPAMAVGVGGGGALLVFSLRRLTPPGTLVAAKGLPATILGRGLLTCCFFAGDAYIPYALNTVRRSPTAMAALALIAATMTWTAGSWLQARWARRVGPRRLVRSGELLVLAGLALAAFGLLPAVPPEVIILAWAVAGGGIGLAYAPLSVATLGAAKAGEVGKATSALQLLDVLGQAIGTGVAGALIVVGAEGPGRGAGVAMAFAFATAVGLVGVVLGVRLPDRLASTGSDLAS